MEVVSTDRQSATTAPPQSGRIYEPELDVLRFVACFAVFWFHILPGDYSNLVPHFGRVIPEILLAVRNTMRFGVCTFFLLSSYLITKLMIVERERKGYVNLKNFYIRRILRIWPLYLTFVVAIWVLWQFHIFYLVETGRFLAFLFFAGNIYTGIYGFPDGPLIPLWSVSVEEQFYIVWPFLARAGQARLKVAAWAIIAISFLSLILLDLYASNVSLAVWTSSFVQFQFFAFGALLAMRYSRKLPTFSMGTRLAMAAAGFACLMIAAGPLRINRVDPISTLPQLLVGFELMTLGTILFFLSFLGAARGRNNVPKFLTYLGKISFGLYVFQCLAMSICGEISMRYSLPRGFHAVESAVLTLILAMLSYRYLETPFLRLKERFTTVESRPA